MRKIIYGVIALVALGALGSVIGANYMPRLMACSAPYSTPPPTPPSN
jgi:hypothetical protein